MERSKAPAVTPQLLDYLLQKFPDTIPDKLVGEAETARLVGQQDVIRFLKATARSQEKASIL